MLKENRIKAVNISLEQPKYDNIRGVILDIAKLNTLGDIKDWRVTHPDVRDVIQGAGLKGADVRRPLARVASYIEDAEAFSELTLSYGERFLTLLDKGKHGDLSSMSLDDLKVLKEGQEAMWELIQKVIKHPSAQLETFNVIQTGLNPYRVEQMTNGSPNTFKKRMKVLDKYIEDLKSLGVVVPDITGDITLPDEVYKARRIAITQNLHLKGADSLFESDSLSGYELACIDQDDLNKDGEYYSVKFLMEDDKGDEVKAVYEVMFNKFDASIVASGVSIKELAL